MKVKYNQHYPYKVKQEDVSARALSNRLKRLFSNMGNGARGPSYREPRYCGPNPMTPCVNDAFIYDHKITDIVKRNVDYITRESSKGQEREGEERIINQKFIEGIPSWNADDFHYMLVVSPKDSNHLPLDTLAREIVGDMEKDLRTKLQWIGAVHRNTRHHHVHIMIRGRDDKGHKLNIKTRYLHRIVHQIAQERTTALNYRHRHLARVRERETREQGRELCLGN